MTLTTTSTPTLIFPVEDLKADPPRGKCSQPSPRASKFSKGAAARRRARQTSSRSQRSKRGFELVRVEQHAGAHAAAAPEASHRARVAQPEEAGRRCPRADAATDDGSTRTRSSTATTCLFATEAASHVVAAASLAATATVVAGDNPHLEPSVERPGGSAGRQGACGATMVARAGAQMARTQRCVRKRSRAVFQKPGGGILGDVVCSKEFSQAFMANAWCK